MSGDYDRVVAALPRLSPEERAAVAERLKMLASLTPGAALYAPGASRAGAGVPEDELLEAVAKTTLRMSGERVSAPALRRAGQFQALRAKAPEIMAYVSAHAPDRVARRALLELGFELLYRDLVRGGMAGSSRHLIALAHQLPAVIDAAFPGYAACGALGMIVGARRERHAVDGQ